MFEPGTFGTHTHTYNPDFIFRTQIQSGIGNSFEEPDPKLDSKFHSCMEPELEQVQFSFKDRNQQRYIIKVKSHPTLE